MAERLLASARTNAQGIGRGGRCRRPARGSRGSCCRSLAGAGGVEVGEVDQLDQDERARRGLEVNAVALTAARDVDAEQLADGSGDDPDQDPVRNAAARRRRSRPAPRAAARPPAGRAAARLAGRVRPLARRLVGQTQRLGGSVAGLVVVVAAPGGPGWPSVMAAPPCGRRRLWRGRGQAAGVNHTGTATSPPTVGSPAEPLQSASCGSCPSRGGRAGVERHPHPLDPALHPRSMLLVEHGQVLAALSIRLW